MTRPVPSAWHCEWNSHWQQTDSCSLADEQGHSDDDNWCMWPWGSNTGAYTQVSPECQDRWCVGRLVPCTNWRFCHNRLPMGAANRGRCLYCDVSLGRDLTFRATAGECSICLHASADRVEFPGCPAKHTFCVLCVKTAMFGSYTSTLEIRDQVCARDSEGDPQREAGRLHALLPKTSTCPHCRSASTPPWINLGTNLQ
jgi:hypothetical protein